MSWNTVRFDQGYVSSRDASLLRPGEMQQASGCYYKTGDPERPWKMPGRSQFGDCGSSAGIIGLALCQFDSGTDQLVALSGTAYYGATPGTTGTFSSLKTGLTASTTHLSSCHYNDIWYLCNGADRPQALESDGTIRDAGLRAAGGGMTAATADTSASSATSRPTDDDDNTGFSDVANAYDTDTSTYAYASITSVVGATIKYDEFAACAVTGRSVSIKYDIDVPSGGDATVKIYKTETGEATPSTLIHSANYSASASNVSVTAAVADGTTIDGAANNLRVYIVVTVPSRLMGGLFPVDVRLYDIKCFGGTASAASASTASKANYYAVAESDGTRQGRVGPILEVRSGSAWNQATLTFPTAVNSTATEWIVYRTPEIAQITTDTTYAGAAQYLGEIARVPISDTTYVDIFDDYSRTEQPSPVYEMLEVSDPSNSVVLRTHIFDPPPADASFMTVYDGKAIALTPSAPRSLYYSLTDEPEYFPELYVFTKFSLPEHDTLVACAPLDDVLIVGAKGAVFSIDKLPELIAGQLTAGQVRVIAGVPGVVGQYAMTVVEIDGVSYAAWVSPNGIYVSNGNTARRVSDDLDWTTEVNQGTLSTSSLSWDEKNQILWFHFDSDGGGTNDREVAIHMDQTHRKASGQPKYTQPTTKATSHMVSGYVSGVYRRYSGNPSDDKVYLEESGNTDAATGSNVSMTLETGTVYDDEYREFKIVKGNLRTTGAGASRTSTVTVTSGRDSTNHNESVSKEVDISAATGAEFSILRSCDHFKVKVADTGAGTWGLTSLRLLVDGQDEAGSLPR